MSARTPGPWRVRDLNDDFGKNAPQIATLADADGFGKPIASVCYLSEPEREANARLIAAAPDLLAALESLRAQLRAHVRMDVKKHYSLMAAEVAADKAIRRARGEPC